MRHSQTLYEAPRSDSTELVEVKLRGIQRNCVVANSSSFSQDETNPSSLWRASAYVKTTAGQVDAVHLAIHPCSKLQGILAKANKIQTSGMACMDKLEIT